MWALLLAADSSHGLPLSYRSINISAITVLGARRSRDYTMQYIGKSSQRFCVLRQRSRYVFTYCKILVPLLPLHGYSVCHCCTAVAVALHPKLPKLTWKLKSDFEKMISIFDFAFLKINDTSSLIWVWVFAFIKIELPKSIFLENENKNSKLIAIFNFQPSMKIKWTKHPRTLIHGFFSKSDFNFHVNFVNLGWRATVTAVQQWQTLYSGRGSKGTSVLQ